MAVLRSTLRLRHTRDPRAFTRATLSWFSRGDGGLQARGGKGEEQEEEGEEEGVMLPPECRGGGPPKFLSSFLSKFCKSVPRARIKRLPRCVTVRFRAVTSACPPPPFLLTPLPSEL